MHIVTAGGNYNILAHILMSHENKRYAEDPAGQNKVAGVNVESRFRSQARRKTNPERLIETVRGGQGWAVLLVVWQRLEPPWQEAPSAWMASGTSRATSPRT